MAVSRACRILELSRAGYYADAAAHKKRLVSPAVCAANVHLDAAPWLAAYLAAQIHSCDAQPTHDGCLRQCTQPAVRARLA